MILQLTNDERDLLIDLLNASIAETRQEIYRTEKHVYKDAIRIKKNVMEEMLRRLIQTEELHDSKNVEHN